MHVFSWRFIRRRVMAYLCFYLCDVTNITIQANKIKCKKYLPLSLPVKFNIVMVIINNTSNVYLLLATSQISFIMQSQPNSLLKAHVLAHTHRHPPINTHTYTHLCTLTRTHKHTHIHACTHIHALTYASKFIQKHKCIHV